MGKELRTTPVPMKFHRVPKIDGTPWGLKNIQPFFPSLEKLFKTENLANLHEYGIKLSDPVESIVDQTHIRVRGRTIPVHRKTTMILSPYKTMRNDYGSMGLPKRSDVASDLSERLQSPHTAGYVGAITSIALSESGCRHFPKVYGVFTGLANKHTIDISDDYEDLSEKTWFADNIGKTFELKLRTTEGETFTHTRGRRLALNIDDIAIDDLIGIEDIEAHHVDDPIVVGEVENVDVDSENKEDEDEESSELSDVFEISSCDCDDTKSDGLEGDRLEDEEGSEDEEPFAWATFTDVPVITTVMEVCEGTFYDLVKLHPEPAKHTAWVAQIVFALAYAQRNYGFTHNDLHGNNVMFVKTDEEFFLYRHGGQAYKVPTYGYLMKIIDFDRAICSIRIQGMKEPKMFMSNQFHEDEEAGGQYNMEPFFNHEHPHISASPSFDLVRFATSLFWDMFPEGPLAPSGATGPHTHPLFEVFKQWMTQSDGTSVMFRKKMDDHDRYHSFDLYKAIARYCRESAIPRKEIGRLTAFRATPSAAQLCDALVIDA